jgi:hypothetical protein
VNEGNWYLTAKAEVVAHAVSAERGTRVTVVQVEVQRFTECPDCFNSVEYRWQGSPAGPLYVLDAVAQRVIIGLELTDVHPRMKSCELTLAFPDADVTDVDARTNSGTVLHSFKEPHELGDLQPTSVLDEDHRPRPLVAQPLVEGNDRMNVRVKVTGDLGLVVQDHPSHPWVTRFREGKNGIMAPAVEDLEGPW